MVRAMLYWFVFVCHVTLAPIGGSFETLDVSGNYPDRAGYRGGFASGGYGYLLPSSNNNGHITRFQLMNFNFVSVLDLSQLVTHFDNLGGGFTDGTYGYIMRQGGDNGRLIRFSLASFNSVDELDFISSSPLLAGFQCGFTSGSHGFVGTYQHKDYYGALTYIARVARFDLATFDVGSIAFIDIADADPDFAGIRGCFNDGTYGYMVATKKHTAAATTAPGWVANTDVGKIARFSLASFNEVSVIDFGSLHPSMASAANGAFQDGTYGYVVPGSDSNKAKVVRFSLATFSDVTVLDTSIASGEYDLKRFRGGFADAVYGYLVPGKHCGKVARFDLATFTQVDSINLGAVDHTFEGFYDGYVGTYGQTSYGYIVPHERPTGVNGNFEPSGLVVRFTVTPTLPIDEAHRISGVTVIGNTLTTPSNGIENILDDSDGRFVDFNGDPLNFHSWVIFDMGSVVASSSVKMKPHGLPESPKEFSVESSSAPGGPWSAAKVFREVAEWNIGKGFSLSRQPARYYRLNFTSTFDGRQPTINWVIFYKTTTTTTAHTTSGEARCTWTTVVTGSIAGHNIVQPCDILSTTDACKSACEANSACKSIDFKSDGTCCLGDCQIGDGECTNDNDGDYQYSSCEVEQAMFVLGDDGTLDCPIGSYRISRGEECHYAATQLGVTFTSEVSDATRPPGCVVILEVTDQVYFNTYATGAARAGTIPLCRAQAFGVKLSWPAGTCSDLITDEQECRIAAKIHGVPFGLAEAMPPQNGVPLGCWIFSGPAGDGEFEFNTATSSNFDDGPWNPNVQVVCKSAAKFQIVKGAACTGNDCETTAVCPQGLSVVRCSTEPSPRGKGIEPTSNSCSTKGGWSTRNSTRAVATCAHMSVVVRDSGDLFLDDQDVSASCLSGASPLACYCFSWWEKCGSHNSPSPVFAPSGSICTRSIANYSGSHRRRIVDNGYGSKVFALCEQAQPGNVHCAHNGEYVHPYQCSSQLQARDRCESFGFRLCAKEEINGQIGPTCAAMWTSSSTTMGYYIGSGGNGCGTSGVLKELATTYNGDGMFNAACCEVTTTTTIKTTTTTTKIATTTTSAAMSSTLFVSTIAPTFTTTTTTTTTMSLVGSFTLEVSNRTSFVKEPKVKEVLKLAIGELLDVNVSWIHDLNVTLDGRRLGSLLRVGRRLESDPDYSTTTKSGVKVDFRIVIPADPDAAAVITPTIILDRFDQVGLEEATEVIDKVIQSNLLTGGENKYAVKVAYKVIRKSEPSATPTPAPPSNNDDGTPMVVIAATSCGLALLLVVATLACCYSMKRKTNVESKSLLKARLAATAASNNVEFLFPPAVIKADYRHMLRSFFSGVVDASAAKVFITFAMDTRKEDAEETGPGSFYAAAVAQALDAHGIRCCVSLPGAAKGESCHRLLSHAESTCRMLVIVQTAALYNCKKCLREIHAAQERGIELTKLRFETSLPGFWDQWSEVDGHEEADMATNVKQRLKLLPELPEAPMTVQLQPEVLGSFAHELKLKLSLNSKLDTQYSIASLGAIGIDLDETLGLTSKTLGVTTSNHDVPVSRPSAAERISKSLSRNFSNLTSHSTTTKTSSETAEKSKMKRVKSSNSSKSKDTIGEATRSGSLPNSARSKDTIGEASRPQHKDSARAKATRKANADCFGKAHTENFTSTPSPVSPEKELKTKTHGRQKAASSPTGVRRQRTHDVTSTGTSSRASSPRSKLKSKRSDPTFERSKADAGDVSAKSVNL